MIELFQFYYLNLSTPSLFYTAQDCKAESSVQAVPNNYESVGTNKVKDISFFKDISRASSSTPQEDIFVVTSQTSLLVPAPLMSNFDLLPSM